MTGCQSGSTADDRAFTMWHAKHHTPARVLQYEIRLLEPGHFQIIADIRRQAEGFIADTLEQVTNDPKLLRIQTAAILSLGIDTARWFSATKPISADELADGYAELVLRMPHVFMPFVKA